MERILSGGPFGRGGRMARPASIPAMTSPGHPGATRRGTTMATRTWKSGAQGNYFDPANWLDGAPGTGDTTIVSGAGSKPLFYAPGNDPSHFSPDPAPPGYTISGETITLEAKGGTAGA